MAVLVCTDGAQEVVVAVSPVAWLAPVGRGAFKHL